MKRGRPSQARKALARARRAPPPPPPPPAAEKAFDARDLFRLETRFVELRRDKQRDEVEQTIELGEILIEAKPKLSRTYHLWLSKRLHVQSSTAANYQTLAKFAGEKPGVIHRWKELGTSKLYRLARITDKGLGKALATPGLAEMTDRQFAALTKPFVARTRKVTGNMTAHGIRQEVQGFTRKLDEREVPEIDKPEILAGLKKDLVGLIRAARAFLGKLPRWPKAGAKG